MNIEEPHKPPSRRPIYTSPNLLLLFAITMIAVMGVVSLTPAFPKIKEVLNISVEQVGLLITTFTLPGILLTPLLGIMADRIGRKVILVPALFVFALAGTACAFFDDFQTILLFRFLQGVGAAPLISLSTTIIGDIYSGNQLNEAMGFNSAALNIGTSSYPAVGGILASFGWHYPFLLPLVALPVGLMVLIFLKNPEPKNEQDLKTYFRKVWEGFKNTTIIVLFTSSFLMFIIIFGSFLTFLPFFMKERLNSSVMIIGLLSSATSIGSGLSSMWLGKLSRRYSPKRLMVTACFIQIASMLLIPVSSTTGFLLVPCILFGVSNGLCVPSIQSLLASRAPLEYRGAFMSANGMVLRIGQTVGPLLMAFIYGITGVVGPFIAGAVIAVMMLVLIQLKLD